MMKVIKILLNIMNLKSNQVLVQLLLAFLNLRLMIKGIILIKIHRVIRKGSQHLLVMRVDRILSRNEMMRLRLLLVKVQKDNVNSIIFFKLKKNNLLVLLFNIVILWLASKEITNLFQISHFQMIQKFVHYRTIYNWDHKSQEKQQFVLK